MINPRKNEMPHSFEAEQTILGAVIITQGQALDDVIAAGVTPDDFYSQANRSIFEAFLALAAKSMPIELPSIAETLKASGSLERAGGPAYLVELADAVATATTVPHYAQALRDKTTARVLIEAGRSIAEYSLSPAMDISEMLEYAEQKIMSVRTGRKSGGGLRRIDGESIGETLRGIETRAASQGQISGVPTGFTDLDWVTTGWQPGDLVIIAGRPSMGKTALALNLAVNAAMPRLREAGRQRAPYAVAFFSLEMLSEQLRLRLISCVGQIDMQMLRTGQGITAQAVNAIQTAANDLAGIPLYLDDAPAQTAMEVRAKARRLKMQLIHHGADLGLIIVDYLQLMRGKAEKREQEIAQISQGLKTMAKELQVPVIALSQLNRELEKRTDKKPGLADLRESGAIEQDADVVAFVYRPGAYSETADPRKAELLIRKQRQGPTKDIPLWFDKQFSRFTSRAADGAYEGY